MTLSKLIKTLQKLEREGWGRANVAVNKDTLNTGNGTWNICDIRAVEALSVCLCDGDGFRIENKDGSERMVNTVVLNGPWIDEPIKKGAT